MKSIIRNLLNTFRIDLTKNLKYDRLSKAIISSSLTEKSNTVDIGCHKGEILDLIMRKSTKGKHYGFEPIPAFYTKLTEKYKEKSNITILPYALGDSEEGVMFNHVKNAPAYSGLKQRNYDNISPDIEKIHVEQRRLDDCIPEKIPVALIKIDVEGAEFMVLKGAKRILQRDKPILLFEFGLGASDYYGTNPKEFFTFLEKFNYRIYTLDSYLKQKEFMSISDFIQKYNTNEEYYFVAG
jgi:FkbM family methyltransferase